MTTTTPLHPDATGFTLLRVLPNGGCRNYTAVEFARGWAGADHFLRTLRAVGYVIDSKGAPDGWHVLDVLDAKGDIVQDFAIPPTPSRAMKFIIRKLGLRVERVEDALAVGAGAR